MLVYLPGSHIIVFVEGNVEVSLVVTEVKIGLTTIIEDVDFAVLGRGHSTGINVHIRVNLDRSDL